MCVMLLWYLAILGEPICNIHQYIEMEQFRPCCHSFPGLYVDGTDSGPVLRDRPIYPASKGYIAILALHLSEMNCRKGTEHRTRGPSNA
jgi:hypothetical protein